MGIIMVGIFDTMNAANGDNNGGSCSTTVESSGSCSNTVENSSVRDQTIGILLIVGQSIMSVIQGENLAFYFFPFAMHASSLLTRFSSHNQTSARKS